MTETGSEEQVLQQEIARLESEGYDVFLQPRAPLVPTFSGSSVDALRAAFLLAWAIFEAEGRASVEGRFDRPQTPSRQVEVLGQEGLLTPTDTDRMRDLSEKRNRLIHGDLGTVISAEELDRLIGLLRQLSAASTPEPSC